jgi:hypothetical protein
MAQESQYLCLEPHPSSGAHKMQSKNTPAEPILGHEWSQIVKSMTSLVKRRETAVEKPKVEAVPEKTERPKPRFSSGVYAIVSAVERSAFLYPKS